MTWKNRQSHRAPPDASLPPAPWPALTELVASLGADVLGLARAPHRVVEVSDVLLFDPTDRGSVRPKAIVLALGMDPADAEAFALVDTAGRDDAAAIVFRTSADLPARILRLAASLDLALLVMPPEMSWGQMYSLIRTALSSTGAAVRGEVAGVPIGDLFALADATAAAVGAAVTIEDPQWRVLSYSNLGHPIDEPRRETILGRIQPPTWQRRIEEMGVGHALRSGTEVVHVDGTPARRLVAPVRMGNELLASIWVAEGDIPLGPDAEQELARAAQRATVHLISHRASEDIKRRMRGAFVHEILEGRLGARAEHDLVGAVGPFTVFAFEPVSESASPQMANPEQVLSIVSLHCENAHAEAMCALIADRMWAVVPLPGGRERERSIALAEKIINSIDNVTPIRLAAGLGTSVATIRDIPRSRRAAEQALRVRARGGTPRVVHIRDVRSHAVLLDLIELASPYDHLHEGRLADLLEAEPGQAEQHRVTLRAYLDCSGNVAEAARRLDIHPNTLRYRVRRAVELSGLDLADPDERILVELQLRMAT